MEKVVNKLSEIEAAAVAIMENANSRKKEISDKTNQDIAAFDKKIDAETTKSLSELKVKLQTETEQELNKLKTSTQQALEALEDEYNKNHSALADEIFRTIIRE
jgi:tRNA uridine 5-carbamoylmethylation protein Kti12